MNMPRQYKRNNRGISISLGQRQMNISKRVMYLLGNPDAITFVPSEEYEDWMILLPGDLDIPCAETGFIHYRRKQKKSGAYISSVRLIRKIYTDYGIVRNNHRCFSPFYMSDPGEYNGIPCVHVCMDNFDQYYDRD